MLAGTLEVGENGVGSGGKDAAESVGDLAQVRRSFAPTGQAGADDQQYGEESEDGRISGGFGGGEGIVHEGAPERDSQQTKETPHTLGQGRVYGCRGHRGSLGGFLEMQSLGIGVHGIV